MRPGLHCTVEFTTSKLQFATQHSSAFEGSFCFFSTLCVWRTDSRCCESYEINDFLTRLHFPAGNYSIGVNLQILGNVAGNLSVPIGGLSYYIRG